MISWSAAETSYLPSDRITCVEYTLSVPQITELSVLSNSVFCSYDWSNSVPTVQLIQKSNLLISILFLIDFEPLLPLSQAHTQNDKLSLMPKFYSRDVWKTRCTKQNSTHTLQNLVTFSQRCSKCFSKLGKFFSKVICESVSRSHRIYMKQSQKLHRAF